MASYDVIVIGTGAGGGIGAVNPALTAMANALRVGDRILERLGTRATTEVMA
jgi:pyruvate/2-oxoglutarate dehydrogenase complex dihydrolipoamide dehydrogenase (E3) component